MKRSFLQSTAAAVACLGMLMPQAAFAAPAAPRQIDAGSAEFRVNDVALRPGGLLVGKVVDARGLGQAGALVSVQYEGREIVRTTTDANGVFAARGLRGGQYQIQSPNGQSICRLWAEGTAPPAAKQAAVVVTGQDVVRGQFGYGMAWIDWMRDHPYLTAGTVAAAIAIPVALATNDDWKPGS